VRGDIVQRREGGVIEDLHGPVALGYQEVLRWVGVGEGRLVGLLVLFVAGEESRGGGDRG
jgi:hypothetical protein